MKPINAFLLTDGYKTSHRELYPDDTTLVYSNFTPRSLRHAIKGLEKIVSFGQQMVVKQIHDYFNEGFFHRDKQEVIDEIYTELSMYLGCKYDVSAFEDLHDLGYLPVKIKAIQEGEIVPVKTPILTIVNTHPKFFWLTNYLETLISFLLWKPATSASIAYVYRKLTEKFVMLTDPANSFLIDFMQHDFSARGLDSLDATISSGLGHATSFLGSDTLTAIHGARKYYAAEGPVVLSVKATEHSVACANTIFNADGSTDELEGIRYQLSKVPAGIFSMVSDTFDLWRMCTQYLPALKQEILARPGKLVIRPDSGNPVDIVCGLDNGVTHNRTPQDKGVIELLWEVFGGTINNQGYKVLDPHIGAIYGDSITIERAEAIYTRLEKKGFAATNIVLGVGSFTYQLNTRDTLGFAMKATYIEKNGVPQNIFKDPITDDGTKKSATGLLKVVKENGEYKLIDKVSKEEENTGELKTIYENGTFYNTTTFQEIRERLKK